MSVDVVLSHVTTDPEGVAATPCTSAPEAPAPRPGRVYPDIADNYLLTLPKHPPAGYGRTVLPCGCACENKLERTFVRGDRVLTCKRCSCSWVPASRNDLEIATGDYMEVPGMGRISGSDWTRPHGDYK